MPTATHPAAPNAKALLDYAEAQSYLGGISRSTLKTLVGNGEILAITINRRRLFPVAELDRYIAARLAAAGDAN